MYSICACDGLLRRRVVRDVPAIGERVVEAELLHEAQMFGVEPAVLAQEIQPVEARVPARLPHPVERLGHVLDAAQVVDEELRPVDEQQRLVVDLQVAGVLEVVLDPEGQEVRHQVALVGDAALSASLVLPHDGELHLVDELAT